LASFGFLPGDFLRRPIDAVVVRPFRSFRFLRLRPLPEQLLQLLDLPLQFLAPRSQRLDLRSLRLDPRGLRLDPPGLRLDPPGLRLDLRIALPKLFFEFGNPHAGTLCDSGILQKISFQNGQIHRAGRRV